MSYRRGFPALEGTHTTSDNGWGCMLRSGQMLLAQTLVRHCLGTAWLRSPHASGPAAAARRREESKDRDEEEEEEEEEDLVAAQPPAFQATLRRIAGLFVDHPQCPFSVHSIARRGAAHGVRVGAWFAPTPVCLALRDLVACAEPAGLACVVARDATVRLDEVRAAFRRAPAPAPHFFCAALRPAAAAEAGAPAPATRGLLLAVPLRLGVTAVEPAYYAPLTALFRARHCVGIVGGEPHSSLYFFAAQGQDLYFLNPHVVQRALAPPVPPDALDLASYRATTVRRTHCSTLDPSLALGFYFRDEPDFDAFLAEYRADTLGTSTLFAVVDSVQPLSSTTVHDDELDSWEIVSDT